MTVIRLLLILLLWAPPLRAEDAAAPVERLHQTLLAVMKDGPRLGFDGRARQLAPVIEQVYDMPGMTRSAIGSQAAKLSPEQLDRIAQAFTRYTVATYARQFAGWDGERFETGTPVAAHGGGTMVPTRIITGDGEAAKLSYLMRDTGSGWRIEDVLLDGTISQLAVRRAEFQTVLKLKGADALAEMLDNRAAEQAKP
ncbi:MAG TPA: ABC transporter substrate-binding protein [Magnetospirillum sp.]|nr:ABC transporter substrate-binding protein [Magnetospirillum sp.]